MAERPHEPFCTEISRQSYPAPEPITEGIIPGSEQPVKDDALLSEQPIHQKVLALTSGTLLLEGETVILRESTLPPESLARAMIQSPIPSLIIERFNPKKFTYDSTVTFDKTYRTQQRIKTGD